MIKLVSLPLLLLIISACTSQDSGEPKLLQVPQVIGLWCDSRGVVGVEDYVLEISEGGPTGYQKKMIIWSEGRALDDLVSPLEREGDDFHNVGLVEETYTLLPNGDLKITGYRYSAPDTPVTGILTRVETADFPTRCRQELMREMEEG